MRAASAFPWLGTSRCGWILESERTFRRPFGLSASLRGACPSCAGRGLGPARRGGARTLAASAAFDVLVRIGSRLGCSLRNLHRFLAFYSVRSVLALDGSDLAPSSSAPAFLFAAFPGFFDAILAHFGLIRGRCLVGRGYPWFLCSRALSLRGTLEARPLLPAGVASSLPVRSRGRLYRLGARLGAQLTCGELGMAHTPVFKHRSGTPVFKRQLRSPAVAVAGEL